MVHVLAKPPFLTEKEAINDSVRTIRYVFKLGKKLNVKTKIALEPVFVKKPSLVYDLYKKNSYKTVWLWSIIKTLEKISDLGDIQVGISSEGVKWYEMPKNCEECTRKVLDDIIEYNVTQNVDSFKDLKCGCREKWERELNETAIPLRDRISKYSEELGH